MRAESGHGPVTGVIVTVEGMDNGENDKAVVRDSKVAAAIFGSVCGVNVEIFRWLAAEEWHLDVMSAYDLVGTITKIDQDLEACCMVIEGFKPVP